MVSKADALAHTNANVVSWRSVWKEELIVYVVTLKVFYTDDSWTLSKFEILVCLSSSWSKWQLCEVTSAQRGYSESGLMRHCKRNGLWPLAVATATFLARWCWFTARLSADFPVRPISPAWQLSARGAPTYTKYNHQRLKAQCHVDAALKIGWGDTSMGKFGTGDRFENNPEVNGNLW